MADKIKNFTVFCTKLIQRGNLSVSAIQITGVYFMSAGVHPVEPPGWVVDRQSIRDGYVSGYDHLPLRAIHTCFFYLRMLLTPVCPIHLSVKQLHLNDFGQPVTFTSSCMYS